MRYAARKDQKWRIFVGALRSRASVPRGQSLSSTIEDGLSIRVVGAPSTSGSSIACEVSARVIYGQGEDWWLISDQQIIARIPEKQSPTIRRLHEDALRIAFLVCSCCNVSQKKILLEAGWEHVNPLSIHNLRLKKLDAAELSRAPRSLTETAHGELYRLDDEKIKFLGRLAKRFLRHAEIIGSATFSSRLALSEVRASQSLEVLRYLQENDTVRFEISTLDHTWPTGEIEALMSKYAGLAEGFCVRLVGKTTKAKLGRARVYHVPAADEDWWVFGDVRLAGFFRGHGLYEKLCAARVTWCSDHQPSPPTRMVWAPGLYAYSAAREVLGFEELEPEELFGAPQCILELASESRRLNRTLRSGLCGIRSDKIQKLRNIAARMEAEGVIDWRGMRRIKIPWDVDNRWRFMEVLNGRWLRGRS